MAAFEDLKTLQSAVRKAVDDVTITDIHTHLFPPAHGNLLLWGVDELLTYHYLVAELFTIAPRDLTTEKFWKLSKREQANLVWEHVFLKHGALSEAARGVITTLSRLGLDIAGRDLKSIRQWFADQDEEEYLRKVFELANINYAVMTNNPFDKEEAGYWKADKPGSDLLKAALRIDSLILNWPSAAQAMADDGYDVKGVPTGGDFEKARQFLRDWSDKMDPVYMAASLPPDFRYPSGELSSRVVHEVVLPVAEELNLPMAMMIGVRKRVNPALRDGGDAVGVADVTAVQQLCQENPNVKFLVTMLSRDNQHELTVLARKFGNLHIFGCWWYLNNPSIIEEMTRMRLELLGATVTLQHSDARVLDQLIYKWHHTRKIVAKVLVDKYTDLYEAGWRPTEDELQRDVRNVFGGAFEEFLAK
ncbi:MAG: glucuronate isomerase [Planctomycetota bacterium]